MLNVVISMGSNPVELESFIRGGRDPRSIGTEERPFEDIARRQLLAYQGEGSLEKPNALTP